MFASSGSVRAPCGTNTCCTCTGSDGTSHGPLPRPPEASQFFDEWRAATGQQQSQENTIYRQKFNAYYGKSVADAAMGGGDFAVRSETLFPVFLATAVFATGWTTVLWDTNFVTEAANVWDVLKFAFLGAYVFIVQSLMRRFFQSDLRPSAYASAILRIVVALLSMTALYQIIGPRYDQEQEIVAAVAFGVGIFPIIALQALERLASTVLRVIVPHLTPEYPLDQLDGLNVWYESRLLEEGIEDMQNLATANLVDVILHTRVPVGRLVDWIDQAHLYLHLDRSERGAREARRARKGHHREGTKAREALRQIGVRTATDLLKAFPRDDLDASDDHALEHLEAAGLGKGQIHMLVQVLDENTDLAPVWNWQTRGVVARCERRRPRSERATQHASSVGTCCSTS